MPQMLDAAMAFEIEEIGVYWARRRAATSGFRSLWTTMFLWQYSTPLQDNKHSTRTLMPWELPLILSVCGLKFLRMDSHYEPDFCQKQTIALVSLHLSFDLTIARVLIPYDLLKISPGFIFQKTAFLNYVIKELAWLHDTSLSQG